MINVSLHCLVFFRHALDIREHYERKLERANNLYMELSAIMLQLEVREKELMKYVDQSFTKAINVFYYYLNVSPSIIYGRHGHLTSPMKVGACN